MFFADTDFVLPVDVVNAFAAGDKAVLGLGDGVFGVANALPPHAGELLPRRASRSAVEPITEFDAAQETELRRRHETAPDAVERDLEAMGWLYRRGAAFPFRPAWLTA